MKIIVTQTAPLDAEDRGPFEKWICDALHLKFGGRLTAEIEWNSPDRNSGNPLIMVHIYWPEVIPEYDRLMFGMDLVAGLTRSKFQADFMVSQK